MRGCFEWYKQGRIWVRLWACSRNILFHPTLVSCNAAITLRNWMNHTFLITWTCPLNPVVPLSTNGTLAARHILLTCRRASRLSSALKTMVNFLNHSILNCLSLMLSWYASILTTGLNRPADSLATYVVSTRRLTSPIYADVPAP